MQLHRAPAGSDDDLLTTIRDTHGATTMRPVCTSVNTSRLGGLGVRFPFCDGQDVIRSETVVADVGWEVDCTGGVGAEESEQDTNQHEESLEYASNRRHGCTHLLLFSPERP